MGGNSAAKESCLPPNLTPDSPRCCDPKRLFPGLHIPSSNLLKAFFPSTPCRWILPGMALTGQALGKVQWFPLPGLQLWGKWVPWCLAASMACPPCPGLTGAAALQQRCKCWEGWKVGLWSSDRDNASNQWAESRPASTPRCSLSIPPFFCWRTKAQRGQGTFPKSPRPLVMVLGSESQPLTFHVTSLHLLNVGLGLLGPVYK